jgi:hypothetical protein
LFICIRFNEQEDNKGVCVCVYETKIKLILDRYKKLQQQTSVLNFKLYINQGKNTKNIHTMIIKFIQKKWFIQCLWILNYSRFIGQHS